MADTPIEAPAPPPRAPRLYSVKTVAGMLDVSERYVWQLIADGGLAAVRPTPRRTLVRDDDLADYIDAHTERAS